MKQQDLINEFRQLISQLRFEVESASAMQLYDTHKISENVVCGLLRELYGYASMRNLNSEQRNFPGIDLADDAARIAVQVTATADLEKIKGTIETFTKKNLQERYDRLIVYILTSKQSSYSQSAVNSAVAGIFSFSTSDDIWDYQDISAQAASASPKNLLAAVNILKTYLRGIPIGLADEDIDPPANPTESILPNLLEIHFPTTLFVAQIREEIRAPHQQSRARNMRDAIWKFCKENELHIPSGFVTHAGSIVTFIDLESAENPFRYVIEDGTAEPLPTSNFYGIDEDHHRVFKSLLRSVLQQRLVSENVLWMHMSKQFAFMPRLADGDVRSEIWKGDRQSKRMVFTRQYYKNNPSKVLMQKHLSFSVDFHQLSDYWYMSVVPSWFFSYGTDYKPSPFGHDNLSWIKKQENNQAIINHFRFLSAWLRSIDTEDLFSETRSNDSPLTFGDQIELQGSPPLDESLWAPLPKLDEDSAPNPSRGLFKR